MLLAQCFYYRGFTWRDEAKPPPPISKPDTPNGHSDNHHHHSHVADERTALLPDHPPYQERRGSDWSVPSPLSPAVPLVSDVPPPSPPPPPPTRLQNAAWNAVAILMVCAAGVAGWYLSRGNGDVAQPDRPGDEDEDDLALNVWGQVFGYLCAVLYLGSRLPQILLNWRRKSTEGVSMLFFLFACLGNLTYVLSILAYEPHCRGGGGGGSDARCRPGEARHLYGRYILVNLSWLAGSAGTLLLDLGIFVQFFVYSSGSGSEREDDEEYGRQSDDGAQSDDERSIDGDRWDQRPVLQRNGSDYSEPRSQRRT